MVNALAIHLTREIRGTNNCSVREHTLFNLGLFTRRESYPSKQVTLALTFFFLLRRVCKAATVTQVGGLPYLRAKPDYHGRRVNFSLENTPGRFNPPIRINVLCASCPGL